MNHDIQIIALPKGEERYVYIFNDETKADVLRAFGRHASDPQLSFSWMDAAMLSQQVRQMATETAERCVGR